MGIMLESKAIFMTLPQGVILLLQKLFLLCPFIFIRRYAHNALKHARKMLGILKT